MQTDLAVCKDRLGRGLRQCRFIFPAPLLKRQEVRSGPLTLDLVSRMANKHFLVGWSERVRVREREMVIAITHSAVTGSSPLSLTNLDYSFCLQIPIRISVQAMTTSQAYIWESQSDGCFSSSGKQQHRNFFFFSYLFAF